jgi:carbamoyl-phosphate synthase large subunit
LRKGKSNLVILKSSVGSPPAMALVNELKKNGIKVIGVDSDPLSAGLYLCDKGHVIHNADHPKFIDDILRICDIEKPNLMLPGPDLGILKISKIKELLAKRGVLVLCPDYDTTSIFVNKKMTYQKLESLGIPIPKIFTKKSLKFPCVIKPSYGSGGKDVYFVRNKTEFNSHISKVKQPVIQELLVGTEYTVDIFSDLDGIPLSIIPRKRIQTESGVSIKGVTVYDKIIIDYCDKIARKLRLIGPSCIQCIKNKRSVKFIEVNLRFGGGSILSLKADPSIVSNLIKIGRGEKPTPSKNFEIGLTMLRYYKEVFVPSDKILPSVESK